MPSKSIVPLPLESVAEIPAEMAICRCSSGHLQSLWFSFQGATMEQADAARESHSRNGTFYAEHGLFNQVRAAAVDAFARAVQQDPFDIMVSERRHPDGSIWWNLVTRHPCPMPTPKPQKKLPGKKAKSLPAPKRSHHKKRSIEGPLSRAIKRSVSPAREPMPSSEGLTKPTSIAQEYFKRTKPLTAQDILDQSEIPAYTEMLNPGSTFPRSEPSSRPSERIPVTWGPIGVWNPSSMGHLPEGPVNLTNYKQGDYSPAPSAAPSNETSASSAPAVSSESRPATAGFLARWLRAARIRIRFWRR